MRGRPTEEHRYHEALEWRHRHRRNRDPRRSDHRRVRLGPGPAAHELLVPVPSGRRPRRRGCDLGEHDRDHPGRQPDPRLGLLHGHARREHGGHAARRRHAHRGLGHWRQSRGLPLGAARPERQPRHRRAVHGDAGREAGALPEPSALRPPRDRRAHPGRRVGVPGRSHRPGRRGGADPPRGVGRRGRWPQPRVVQEVGVCRADAPADHRRSSHLRPRRHSRPVPPLVHRPVRQPRLQRRPEGLPQRHGAAHHR